MIEYSKQAGHISLHTAHTTYQMAIAADGRLVHTFYGPRTSERYTVPVPACDPGSIANTQALEYSAAGLGDFRTPPAVVEQADGSEAADFRVAHVSIRRGKYSLPEMPAFFAEDNAADTLCVTLRDVSGLVAVLMYGVLTQQDVITRAVLFCNSGDQPVYLRKALSMSLDLDAQPLDFVTFDGGWAAERQMHRAPLRPGLQSVGSIHGVSSNVHNPFTMLCAPDCTETSGVCYGFALVYSGNFLMEAEQSSAGIRFSAGIHPQHFAWRLTPGQAFFTPECAMTYSAGGYTQMSHQFHEAIRAHLVRKPAGGDAIRPVLLNSWEAAYFSFDEEKLLALARQAARAGIDLFVLDDGWFGHRDDDTTSLGDWTADRTKLPEGIPGLCKKINELGMDFGIWVEPEAVSPDSALYRAHPDWALQIPGRETLRIRHQYVLDFTRAEVREGVWQQLRALFASCPIRYVKWDMNRSLANVWSAALPAARQGEVYHRYVLGVYALQQRLCDEFPSIRLENCSGGGARFDCGMLYYAPQIWCSDNTDAFSRLAIQYGTSMCYPPETMGAHFSIVPNHCTGRSATVEARMAAALSGTFGFELDLTHYSGEELDALRPYIAFFRRNDAFLRHARLYRLLPPSAAGAAWMFCDNAASKALVFAVGTAASGRWLPLCGLLPNALYHYHTDESISSVPDAVDTADLTGTFATGTALCEHGLHMPELRGDVPGCMIMLTKAE